MHLSTFGDEDFMGKIRCICQGCHGGTYMQTWARRYALKRSLQWRDMKHGGAEKNLSIGHESVVCYHAQHACVTCFCPWLTCMFKLNIENSH